MIPVERGSEPTVLATVRQTALGALRALGRSPGSDDIKGYRIVSGDLWRAQHYKCCYCECKIPESYNDVEHYRPKGRADRHPGSGDTHGYWWLAFDWDNLLFACSLCNRSGKNDQFPLRFGSFALQPEQLPLEREHPLLIDPAGRMKPTEHIQFVPSALQPNSRVQQWWARPREGSLYGSWTIRVCNLNHSNLLELRGDYVENFVKSPALELRDALRDNDAKAIGRAAKRVHALMTPTNPFSLLSYDALRTIVPAPLMRSRGRCWPDPDEIPLIPL